MPSNKAQASSRKAYANSNSKMKPASAKPAPPQPLPGPPGPDATASPPLNTRRKNQTIRRSNALEETLARQAAAIKTLKYLSKLQREYEVTIDAYGHVTNAGEYKHLVGRALREREAGDVTLWLALSNSPRYDADYLRVYPLDPIPLGESDRRQRMFNLVEGVPSYGPVVQRPDPDLDMRVAAAIAASPSGCKCIFGF